MSESLGRYQLHRRLGQGGMGEVWLATIKGAVGFEKTVAVKRLHERLAGDPDRIRALLREAVLGVSLDHEHIVQVFDLGEDSGRYYVAMEFVRGHSLSHVLEHVATRGDYVPVRHAVHIVRCLCCALEYVHGFRDGSGEKRFLIHGDVSPSNVLLGVDGRIKLSDFGVATIGRELSGAIVGKVAYLPPEALAGADRAQSWDVYASAVVLLATLRGDSAASRAAELLRVTVKSGVAAALGRDDVPAELVALLERGSSPQEQRRYASAQELRDGIDAAFPRKVDDAEKYQEWIASLYRSPSFVGDHGALPSTGTLSKEIELSPFLAETIAASEERSTSRIRRARPIRFGISPAVGSEGARKIGNQVAETLARVLEREVIPVVLADYRMLLDCLSGGDVDLAWMPPLAYLDAWDRGATPLVAAVRGDGSSYESAIIVATEARLDCIEDLRGKTAAWVNRDSASGYVFAAGLVADELGPLQQTLGEQHFFGSHRAVCEAVAKGWANFGATYAKRDEGKLSSCGWWDMLDDQDVLRPIAFAGPIPADNIACRPAFPRRLRDELKELFEGLHHDDAGRELLSTLFGASRFEAVEHEHYEPLRAIVAAVGDIQ